MKKGSRERHPFRFWQNKSPFLCSMVGLAEVRELKKEEVPFEPALFEPSCSTAKRDVFEDSFQKARQIAIGRKAKELKRKANGEGANAKALKIRKKDLDGIEVSEVEVRSVLEEMSEKTDEDQRIRLPLYSDNPLIYDEFDASSLPLPNSRDFRIKRMVFHDLWRRGFYLTAGVKFGCHYLAYEGEPGAVHAKYFIECLDSDENLSPMRLISLSRVATQVKKTVLLAFVSNDNQIPHYMSLKWWKPY